MKRVMISLAVLMLISVLVIATLPLFVSSTTVRSYIVEHLESLTGRDVTFRGDPSVSFSPFLGIEISDLVISDPKAAGADAPLLNVGKVQAKLDILPALFGDIKITQYLLVRPRLNLKKYSDGKSNWHFTEGHLHTAFQQTSLKLQDEAAADPQSSDLGTFIIEDGAITYEDTIAGHSENITSIGGSIVWPSTSEAALIQSSSIWHGEIVVSAFELSKPLELMAGGVSETTLEFESAPAAIKFAGTANMLSDLFVKGQLDLDTPSLRRFSEFFATDFTDYYLPGQINLSGQIEATGTTMRISDAKISVADHDATGALSFSRDEINNAAIDGTLAFDTIDLSNFVADTSSGIEQLAARPETNGIKVDLRVSANSIDAGFLKLTQVAAAVNVANGNWTFDVGDSEALGGNLIARVGERQEEDGPLVLMELSATNVDAAAVSELFPERLIGMTGQGNFNASLRSKSFVDLLNASGLNGSVTANLVEGSITGINIPQLLAGSSKEVNEEPEEVGAGNTTEFQSAKFNFFISNGIASISQSSISSANANIQMIGRVDLRQGNLALRAQEVTATGPEPERLFIGGTLKAPLVSLKKTELKETDTKQEENSRSVSN